MNKNNISRDRLLDATFTEVYKFGYSGAATASILKRAAVPRGSMYHHFSSKKNLVLAMIQERLIPKVREFFDFEMKPNSTAIDILTHTMTKISKNKMLITHGCPLHRLMFEMEGLDDDIATACENEFKSLSSNLAKILHLGMREGTIKQNCPNELAEFIIASSWGLLSRPASLSSAASFIKDSTLLIHAIRR